MTLESPVPSKSATFLPTILTLLVLAGGWVYNYATTQALIRDHDRRITSIELTYTPKDVHVEQDKAIALEQEETRVRLDRIEAKLDLITGVPEEVRTLRGQVQDLKAQVMQVRILLNERTVPVPWKHEQK